MVWKQVVDPEGSADRIDLKIDHGVEGTSDVDVTNFQPDRRRSIFRLRGVYIMYVQPPSKRRVGDTSAQPPSERHVTETSAPK